MLSTCFILGHPGGSNCIKPASVADVTYAGYYIVNW